MMQRLKDALAAIKRKKYAAAAESIGGATGRFPD